MAGHLLGLVGGEDFPLPAAGPEEGAAGEVPPVTGLLLAAPPAGTPPPAGVPPPAVPPVEEPPPEDDPLPPVPEESVWLLVDGGVSWTLPTREGSSTIWVTATSSGGRLGRWGRTRTVTTPSPR